MGDADHHMEDDCSDDNTDNYEWGFAKSGDEVQLTEINMIIGTRMKSTA